MARMAKRVAVTKVRGAKRWSLGGRARTPPKQHKKPMMARLIRTETFTLLKVAMPKAAEAAGSIRVRARATREMPRNTKIVPSTVVRVILLPSVFTIASPPGLVTTPSTQRPVQKV